MSAKNIVPDRDALLRARAQNDKAIIILTRGTGENIDNNPLPGEYYLSDEEEKMIDAICNVFEKTVVVLNTGYPIDMRWTETYNIKAILYVGLAGQAATEVLCEILDGRTNPSGKLPDTWIWDYSDNPTSVNFMTRNAGESPILSDDAVWVDTCYEEGIYVGYRYFETFGKSVAFPFGHGLSYTDFAIDAIQHPNHPFNFDVTITNTGTCAGREVVTIYAKLPGTVLEQPTRQLVAFAKTNELKPGEVEILTLCVNRKYLATYHPEQKAWIFEKGMLELYVGGNVRDAKHFCTLTQAETEILLTSAFEMPGPADFAQCSSSTTPPRNSSYAAMPEISCTEGNWQAVTTGTPYRFATSIFAVSQPTETMPLMSPAASRDSAFATPSSPLPVAKNTASQL